MRARVKARVRVRMKASVREDRRSRLRPTAHSSLWETDTRPAPWLALHPWVDI